MMKFNVNFNYLFCFTLFFISVKGDGPKFTKEYYVANFSEASSRDMFVTKVAAIDAAYSDNVEGKLKYSIESGDSSGIFRIDPTNGIVRLAKDQSFIYDVFTLNVSVSDGKFKDYASLTIKILSANKQSPLFTRPFYSTTVDERAPVGSHIVTVEAYDNDDGIYAEVTYSIFSSYLLRWFKIDSKTGDITTVAPLDKKKHQSYSLTVLAKDGGHRIGLAIVKISVKSDSDNPPQFLVDKYEVAVCSNTAPNTNILPVIAFDKDLLSPSRTSKNRIIYSISHIGLPDSPSSRQSTSSSTSISSPSTISSSTPFRIRKKSGLIYVYGNLSNSIGSVYTFQVKAVDESGNEAVVPVTIKINGPCKVEGDFVASYEATVFETAKVNSIITSLNVTNPDNLELTLAGVNSDASKFKLGEQGQIYLIDPLDRETVSRYILVVKVFDKISHTVRYLNMFIDVLDTNDNVPIFDSDSYWIEVSEDQEVGSSIGRVHALDSDVESSQKPIVYKLEGDNQSETGDEYFELDSGLIKLLRPLDRETNEWHNLTVTITDGKFNNQTSLCIKVIDVNDNPPQFSLPFYNASIREGSPVGMVVTTIDASDADDVSVNTLSYFIISGDPFNQFSIKDTGELVVNKLLKHKDKSLFELTILVSDTKYNSTTKVSINVLEALGPNCLKSEYVEMVSEDIELGTEILKVEAESRDGLVTNESVHLYYSLFLDNDESPINSNFNEIGLVSPEDSSELPFALNSKTGVLTVIAPLDREKKSTYFLLAKVHDDKERENMCSSAIEIIVSDINDNEPNFTANEYNVTIPEDAELGIVVGKVHATDLDQGRNGEVHYSLTESAEDTFTIDKDTGLIRLNKPLDREKIEKYNLTVRATDSGLPPLSSSVKFMVSLEDVNDNFPVFTSTIYNVSIEENVSIGTEIITIEAKDPDIGPNGDITYAIIEGSNDNSFTIDPKTGIITVAKPLDSEVISNFILNVKAVDGGSPPLSSKTLVNVTITDVNDNGPVCERSQYVEMVPENTEIDSYLLKIAANDPDEGPNGQLHYNLSLDSADYDFDKESTNSSNLPFKIDPREGILRVASLLDREEKSRYLLRVTVHDNLERDRTCSSTVEIIISDVNDNAPVFSGPDFTFLVPEDAKIGSFVGKASATDKDSGVNAKIIYSLITLGEGNDGTFTIDTTSGSIHTAKPLDRETIQRYNVLITATDSGSPTLFSTQMFEIHILDVNDNAPKFTENHYTTSVYENVSVGISLIQVVATSLDTGINADITYAIIAGNEGNCFTVHPKSGSISVVKSLDRETTPEYILTIQAKDGGIPSLSSETKVTITILDVNDNAPSFNQASYSAIIREDTHVGEKVIHKVASDADIGENGQINYFFKPSSLSGSSETAYQTKFKEFEIDPKTGVITVASPLDREMLSSYVMEVVAIDRGSPPLSSSILITIDLSDVSGYPSKFDQNNSTLFIQVCIFNANGTYTCLGPNDYRGLKCEIDGRRACNPNPCVNGGTCTPSPGSINGFHCECPPTLGGLTCEKSRFCSKSSPCLNNGVCEESLCKCKSGWRGSHCEEDIDECSLSNISCSPPATCINLLGSYRCICPVDVTTSGLPSSPGKPSLCANFNLNSITSVSRAFFWDDLILPGIFLIVMLFSCCVIIFCCCCFNRQSSKSKRRTNNRAPNNVYRTGLEGDEFLLEICNAFPSDSSGNIKRFSKLSGVESSALLGRPFSTEPLPNHHFHQALQASAATGGGLGGVGVGTPNGPVSNVVNGQAGLINNRPNSFHETMNNFDEVIRTPMSERASIGSDSRPKKLSVPKNSPTSLPAPPYSENESSHLLNSSNESKIQNIGF